MARYKILYIYCSKQDAVAVRTRIRWTENTQLMITSSSGKKSLNYIAKQLKKSGRLQEQDYVFAIDSGDTSIFINDCEEEAIYHFQSISAFFHWFGKVF